MTSTDSERQSWSAPIPWWIGWVVRIITLALRLILGKLPLTTIRTRCSRLLLLAVDAPGYSCLRPTFADPL